MVIVAGRHGSYSMPTFDQLPLSLTLLVFVAAAIVVWIAGTRLSGYAEIIAEHTGIGQVFIGALLLGGITSLPEGATTVSASAMGNAPLAVNNLIGGVAMQVAILAFADAYIGGRAISTRIEDPSVLVQGILLITMLSLAAAGIAVGDVLVFGVGLWSLAIFLTAILAFYLVHSHSTRDTWVVERPASARRRSHSVQSAVATSRSLGRVVVLTVVAALIILVAGFVLAQTGDALAVQTGLGSSFVGAVMVAIATSLPEVSTTFGAVRLGAYAMAFSGIFGTNVLDTAILFLADAVYPGGPVLAEVGTFSIVAALLGILLTAVYVAGMLERRNTVVLRMGFDSALVIVLYIGGLAVLYSLR
jgi:cation:H+ antiporter